MSYSIARKKFYAATDGFSQSLAMTPPIGETLFLQLSEAHVQVGYEGLDWRHFLILVFPTHTGTARAMFVPMTNRHCGKLAMKDLIAKNFS